MQVREIMVEPVTIDKSEKLSYALDLMDKFDTRRLLVLHKEEVFGIVTMRNITKELGTRKKSNLPASALHVATATTNNYYKILSEMDVFDGVVLMNKNDGILLVMNNDKVMGWITPQQVLEHYPFNDFAAEKVMRRPITIGPGERVNHARRIMLDKNIGRLPVMDNWTLVGIVTEHDIANSLRAFRDLVSGNQQDNRIKNLLVEDIMTRKVITVNTGTPVREVVSLMIEKNIGGLPVMNDKELAGVITRRCLLEAIVKKI